MRSPPRRARATRDTSSQSIMDDVPPLGRAASIRSATSTVADPRARPRRTPLLTSRSTLAGAGEEGHGSPTGRARPVGETPHEAGAAVRESKDQKSKERSWVRLNSTLQALHRKTICSARRPKASASLPQTGQAAISLMYAFGSGRTLISALRRLLDMAGLTDELTNGQLS